MRAKLKGKTRLAQEGEHLSSKCEVLSSNPSTIKKKKKDKTNSRKQKQKSYAKNTKGKKFHLHIILSTENIQDYKLIIKI